MISLLDQISSIAQRRYASPSRLSRLLSTLRLWQLRARSRQQLAQLDVRQLDDAGISQSERLQELEKPFWR